MKILSVLILFFISFTLVAQDFYFGNDLSYVNQMEDCGAVFKEKGEAKDVYQIFADHGTNLVRVRLWVDPSIWQAPLSQPAGVKPTYNDFEDVKETIQRAKNAGMGVMLGIQYSDTWADPAKQIIPQRWAGIADDLEKLKDSVYNYTVNVLVELDNEGLMPDIVKVGNENNRGILCQMPTSGGLDAGSTVSSSWSRHGQLFAAAFQAVRDVGSTVSIHPKIAVHVADPKNVGWFVSNLKNNGASDFDIIGMSYYYAWHGSSISELESRMKNFVSTYSEYEVMVVETGYLWSTRNYDDLGNIVTDPDPEYLPVTPEKQLEYMTDYTRAVMKGGGVGVVFWEPAWVSTPCRTPWGVGSSHDHLVFFDPENTNFMENGGGRWTEPAFYEDITDVKVLFELDIKDADDPKGMFIKYLKGDEWIVATMGNEGNGIYSYFTYLSPGDSGAFIYMNDTIAGNEESVPIDCAEWDNTYRKYVVGDDNTLYSSNWSFCQNSVVPDEVTVTLQVIMTDQDVSRGVYITGENTDWEIVKMTDIGNNVYHWSGKFAPGSTYAYYYLTTSTWDNYMDYRETVPEECALAWGTDRQFVVPDKDVTIKVVWASCHETVGVEDFQLRSQVKVYPNPAENIITINGLEELHMDKIEIYTTSGKWVNEYILHDASNSIELNVENLNQGMYIFKVQYKEGVSYQRVFIK